MVQEAREYQSIGEVLVALKPEFPDVTISKIRFLESEGLIAPERTASGYRKFYDKDLERLRMILKLQRDEYLPLKVIRERLDGDGSPAAADGAEGETTQAREEAEEEIPDASPGLRLTAEEVAAAAGLDREAVDQLASYGLLRAQGKGEDARFDGDDLVIARIAKEFFRFGVEARHLTMFRHFADREATFFEQIVTPTLRQRNPEARRLASESVTELASAARKLKQALLRANLRSFLSS